VPEAVENGAFVPVGVSCSLAGAREITIVIPGNPQPLAVRLRLAAGTEPRITLRLKMADSGPLFAVVDVDGRLHGARATTQVSIGGCT
jgi:sulfur-oxidizing protein SoxY